MLLEEAAAVNAVLQIIEHFGYLRMPQRLARIVRQQVLFRDIGDIFRLLVLGEQMVERLIFPGSDFGGDRLPPLLGIGIDRVHIENNATKMQEPMANDLPELKLS